MSAIRKLSESTYVFLNLHDNTLDDLDDYAVPTPQPSPNPPSPLHGLGPLDQLPLELLHLTLLTLDLDSLTTFRRVNRRARQTTDALPPYRRILTHIPAAIRGSLHLGTARNVTCQTLDTALCTAACDSCGDFGGYLYLPTCRRVCFLCFTTQPDYLPLSRAEVKRKFGLDAPHLAGLPGMKSIPGRYSSRGIRCRRRETLFDYCEAREAGVAVHGSVEAMERYAAERVAGLLAAYQARVSRGQAGRGRQRPPRSEDPFDGQCSNPRRFMGVIRAPFFGRQRSAPEWGFHCLACKKHHYRRPMHWRRMYTVESFAEHIRECGEVIGGEHVMDQSGVMDVRLRCSEG